MSTAQKSGVSGRGTRPRPGALLRGWRILPAVLLLAAWRGGAAAQTDEELLRDAARYASTPEKKARQEKARAALREQGAEGLRLLMRQVHLENGVLRELAMDRASNLDAAQAVPVLVEFLQDERPATRRWAAYFLGFHPAPEVAAQVRPLLADDETCGAALRTLGKWRVREAVPDILPFLQHERETRRVVAANALRDIGDPATAPALLAALKDPVFTVREVAARALAGLGPPAEQALLGALPDAADPARRHIIRTLGAMRSKRATHVLSRLLLDPDPFVRKDAEEAMSRILGAAPD